DELYFQIASVKEQAYLDGMTGVRNKASYLNTEKHINEMIKTGNAAFSVIVFDMNGLKSINDNLGHEYGDMAIIDATNVLSYVYDKGEIFRIGGDEFIVILNNVSETEVQNSISQLEYRIAAENTNERPYKKPLSMSMGYAIFQPDTDKAYRDVFHRADKRMYDDKSAYYLKHGDRRRR
ncbi:MAG: GGDEF domain-containing protein, partial [Ruminiclostridium sp.]|nr:GGDEF domain-containing protein [Ruminiclostridium sp.]